MAGITSSSALKATTPLLTRARTTPSPLSSSDSKFFGVRLRVPDFSKFDLSVSRTSPISARFGGGGYSTYRPPRKPRRNEPQSEEDEEEDEKTQALDISSIRSNSVRLIDEQQKMVGVVSVNEAQQTALDADLDLVIISPDADPPVVKIMDYDKYRYELQKKKREQLKKSIAGRMDMKELKMGYNIEQHDYTVRLKAARKFLTDGHKVKMIVNLKGRENLFRDKAIQLMKRFQSDVGELATEEASNFKEKNIFMIFVPNKAVIQKAQESPKKADETEVKEVSDTTEVMEVSDTTEVKEVSDATEVKKVSDATEVKEVSAGV